MSRNSVGRIDLDLGLNYKPFKQQMNGISKTSTAMLGKSFAKLGILAAGAFSVGQLTKFGSGAISLASDLQEVQNVVDVTFGSLNKDIDAFAENAGEQFGLSRLEAKRFTGTLGAMVKSMGFTEGEAADMAMQMTGLAGDFASFYNLDSETAFNKIRSGISGETEPLKQLGINMSQANLEAFALSQGITKSVQSMNQQEQALLRTNYLMKVSADAQGDFARTSDSWANQARIMALRWGEFKASFGEGLMTMFAPALRMLNKMLLAMMQLSQAFSSFISSFFGVKKQAASSAKAIATIADSSEDAASGQADLGEQTEKAGKKAKGSLSSFDKLNLLTKPEGSESGVSGALGSVGTGAIGGSDEGSIEPDVKTTKIEAAAIKIRQLMSDAATRIKELWITQLKAPFVMLSDWIKSSIVPGLVETAKIIVFGWISVFTSMLEVLKVIFSDMWTSFTSALPSLLEQIGTFFNTINGMFQEALGFLFGVVNGVWEDILVVWNTYGKGILDSTWAALIGTWESINTVLNEWIKPVFDSVMKAVKDLWNNHLRAMVQSIIEFVAKLVKGALDIYNGFVKPLIDWLVVSLGPTVRSVFNTVVNIIKTAFSYIADAVKHVMRALGGIVDFIAGVFTGDWKRAWGGIKDFFGGIWDAISSILVGAVRVLETTFYGLRDTVKSIFQSIGNLLKTPINGTIELINGAIRGINSTIRFPEWVPGVGGKSLNIPQIPRLASGGIVSSPTLAMVGDNRRSAEAVAPLHELMGMIQSAVQAASGNKEMTSLLRQILSAIKSIELDGAIQLDGRDVGEVLFDVLMGVAKRKGIPWPVTVR